MRKFAILLCLLVLTACQLQPLVPDPPPIGAKSVEEIGDWNRNHIRSLADDWMMPASYTVETGTGDCKDCAVLMMYRIHIELGGNPVFIVGSLNGGTHAWVWWEGRYYESRTGRDVTGDTAYQPWFATDYQIIMRRAATTHLYWIG